MDQQDPGRALKTERRVELDGGLDTRAGVFMPPDRCSVLQNFRFDERGSLVKRKGGSLLCSINALNAAADLPAPVLSDGGAGTGTVAAGTYLVGYTLATVLGTKIGLSNTAAVVVGAGGTRSIVVKIPPLNSGENAGKTNASADDPFNGGYLSTSANIEVYAVLTAGTLTKQTVVAFAWNGTDVAQKTSITAYTTNGAAAPAANQVIPGRSVFWHPGLDATIGWSGESSWAATGQHASVAYLNAATDKNNATFKFSRLPTRIYTTIIQGVAIASDGVGKPKKLHTPDATTVANWEWRVCGANILAAPTGALGAAGNVNGAVLYYVTATYTLTKPDGTVYTVESEASAVLSQAPVNQQVTITRPTVAESGLATVGTWSVYRTVASGTIPFLVSTAAQNIAIATTTFVDNVADANLVTAISPPGFISGSPHHTPPPAGLYMVTEHAGVLFGVTMGYVIGAGDFRIRRTRTTNVLRYSLYDLGDAGAAIDCWPALNSVACGNYSPITALMSFRGLLYVFKQDEIGVVEGDSNANYSYRTIWTGSGAMENSVVAFDDALYCFDQARTTLRISGYSVQDIGYETIQDGWLAGDGVITLTSGEAVVGGGRGGAMPINAIADPVHSEVRWTISDANVDFVTFASPTYTPAFYEYVMNKQPDGAYQFSIFTGAVSGSMKDRRILGTSKSVVATATKNTIFQARDAVYLDWHGNLVLDDQEEGDFDGATAITMKAVFPFFFGDNPEMVKRFRYIYAMVTMGSTVADTLNFSTASLAQQTGAGVPRLMATISGGVNGNQASGEVFTVRMTPIANLDTARQTDRGMLLVLTGSAKSGPVRIRELACKYGDQSEQRSSTT